MNMNDGAPDLAGEKTVAASFSEDEFLPLSALQHLLFCERRAALVLLENIWQDNLFTAEGSALHQKADSNLRTEIREGMRIARGLRLCSTQLRLAGQADVVEFHPSTGSDSSGRTGIALPGISGLWIAYPVEYKRGRLRKEDSFEVQLCAQAICLEEMMKTTIPRGAIFYGKTRRRLDVDFDDDLRCRTIRAAERLHEVFRERRTPPPRFEKKCKSCSLVEYCMPETFGKKQNVKRYIDRTLDGMFDSPKGDIHETSS